METLKVNIGKDIPTVERAINELETYFIAKGVIFPYVKGSNYSVISKNHKCEYVQSRGCERVILITRRYGFIQQATFYLLQIS
jgi:hypothetical protein